MSPMKPTSAIASSQMVSTARPVRSRSATIPGGCGGGFGTAPDCAFATASTSALRPSSRPLMPSRLLPARSSSSSAPAVSRRLMPLASTVPAARRRLTSLTRRSSAGTDASVQSPVATARPPESTSSEPASAMAQGYRVAPRQGMSGRPSPLSGSREQHAGNPRERAGHAGNPARIKPLAQEEGGQQHDEHRRGLVEHRRDRSLRVFVAGHPEHHRYVLAEERGEHEQRPAQRSREAAPDRQRLAPNRKQHEHAADAAEKAQQDNPK